MHVLTDIHKFIAKPLPILEVLSQLEAF